MLESTAPLKFKAHFIDMIETPSNALYLEKKLCRLAPRLAKLQKLTYSFGIRNTDGQKKHFNRILSD